MHCRCLILIAGSLVLGYGVDAFAQSRSANPASPQQRSSDVRTRRSTPPTTTRPNGAAERRPPSQSATQRRTGRTPTGAPSAARQRQATQRRGSGSPRLAQIPKRRPGGPPAGFPLSKEKQRRVDAILGYWEHHTGKIKTFECKFTRENWDFVFGTRKAPSTIDRGTIRFAAPDKGLMRVDDVWKFDPEAKKKAKQFNKQAVQFGEYWVCDGTAVYQFDSRTKKLTETELPPQMRGKAIGDGPLPFLFGARSDSMKQRYWIRELVPPKQVTGEYWLEAIPRRAVDAANFDKIQVQLTKPADAGKDQLRPKSMKVYMKQGYAVYHFADHSFNSPTHRLADFFRSFVKPKAPIGWKKVVEKWNEPSQPPTGPIADKTGKKPLPRITQSPRTEPRR